LWSVIKLSNIVLSTQMLYESIHKDGTCMTIHLYTASDLYVLF